MGCGSQDVVVQDPVVVEVPVTEYISVPEDLLIKRNKTLIPQNLSYGEALQLWADDRAIIDTLLGQLEAINDLMRDVD